MTLLLLALLWPAPCADAGTCWLAWDAAPRATRYEVAMDGIICATVRESRGVYGGTAPPRTVIWPAPGRCAPETTAGLQVRACNEHGCSDWSGTVEWKAVPFLCYDAHGPVPCRGGETP